MARARNIKPGFFKNEQLVELAFEYRLLFAGLWTLADREGRLEDRPKRIRMEIFPADDVNVDDGLNALASSGFIQRYEADGARYIHVLNFVRHQNPHQRESRSEIPPPDGHGNRYNHDPVTDSQRLRILKRDGHKCRRCGATSDLQVDHVIARARGGTSDDENLQILCAACNGSKCAKTEPRLDTDSNASQEKYSQGAAKDKPTAGRGCAKADTGLADSLIPDSGFLIPDSPSLIPDPGKGGQREVRSPSGSRIPPDFPTEADVGWCKAERPELDVAEVAAKFRDYWLGVAGAKGRKADWPATWRNFVRSEWSRSPSARSQPARASPTRQDRITATVAELTGRTRSQPEIVDVVAVERAS